MKILIIDNYDSFTYNLYQYCGEILELPAGNSKISVVRNDEITLKEIKKHSYDRIIISPGPGDPADKKYFGVCADVILELGKTIPVLGVCLGMQGIAHYFGGKIIRAKKPMHGKTSIITHDGKGVFKSLPQEVEVMRYHSLVADPKSLPECLEISAIVQSAEVGSQNFLVPLRHSGLDPESSQNRKKILKQVQDDTEEMRDVMNSFEIMGLRHKDYPIEGVQFHPESIGTEGGKVLLANFLYGN